MPKKTTILIVTLFLFTIGLIYVAIKTEQNNPIPVIEEEQLTEEDALDLIPTINPQTVISFSPNSVDTAQNPQELYSVDVNANTNGQSISGIQLELAYDPGIITNVTVTPSENNLFGQNPAVLINNVDPELGRISFVIALGGLDDEEVNGNGNIANITFNTLFSESQTTEITILPKTTVRTLLSTNSLLREALPLTITLPAPTQEITQPQPEITTGEQPL